MKSLPVLIVVYNREPGTYATERFPLRVIGYTAENIRDMGWSGVTTDLNSCFLPDQIRELAEYRGKVFLSIHRSSKLWTREDDKSTDPVNGETARERRQRERELGIRNL